jgi:hypothetical protein
MMNLLNYAPFWRGEGPRGGRYCTRRPVKDANSGDEIHPRVKVISTGDHGAVSVRKIGDDEQV